jgi:hypothetical protein
MDRNSRRSTWFRHGQAAFHRDLGHHLPPLDDPDAQRAWMGGFQTAWAWEAPPAESADAIANAAHADIDVALMRVLDGQSELAARLFALRCDGSAGANSMH